MKQQYQIRSNSKFGSWWWTIDRWSLSAIFVIIILGIVLSFAASPSVAERIGLGSFFFVKRHVLMVVPCVISIITLSFTSISNIKRLAFMNYCISICLMLITLFYGMEIKGARRWIAFMGFSLQPSEFVKSAFVILSAWMLSEKQSHKEFPGFIISASLLILIVSLLLLQPDLGMTLVIVTTWLCQLFIAGLSVAFMGVMGVVGVMGLIGAYFFLPHVTRRINQFLDPSSKDPTHDLYQIKKSLESFKNGGLFGKGPGEGIVKNFVPDAHADFVFAVAGEEFGLVLCLLIVALFAFVIINSLARALQCSNLFTILAVVGIVSQFALQAFVNMASSLHLIPTKGMTMPFMSYGGSSLVSLGIAMGSMLCLTRNRHGKTLKNR